MTSQALVDGGGEAAAAVPDRRAGRRAGARHARSCARTRSGRAAAAPSSTPSAASTSPCGTCSARSRNQPVARLLGGNYRDQDQAVRLAAVRRAGRRCARSCRQTVGARLQGDQARLAAVRPARREDRRAADPDGPRDGRPGRRADGRCRRQRAFWPHGYKWALRTAQMLADYDVVWFEEALPPDDLEGFIELRRHSPVPIATGEVLTRRQSFRPFVRAAAPWTSSSPTAPSAAA